MGCSSSKQAPNVAATKGQGLVQPVQPARPSAPKVDASPAARSQADTNASSPSSTPTAVAKEQSPEAARGRPGAGGGEKVSAVLTPGAPNGPHNGVRSRSTTPTPSLEGSTHSNSSSSIASRSGRRMLGSASALGLDKMIDEKRDAKTMSERVVHIEVPFGKPIEEVYNGVHDGPVLGSGISGLVRLATHKATGIKYAVKCLDLGLVDTEEGLQQLREEIYIMCQLDHPNIVRLEEVYESHSEIYLVQELCLGGELFDRLDDQPDYHYTEAQCARLIKQMLCSVRYIHSKGIIHRDLKLENFLFSDTGADSELKMIDFGLSKHFKFGEVQHEAVGTPYTVAPEVIRGSYDERCDVWAIGVITYLLLSGESPFGGCGGPEPLLQVRDNILRCDYVFEPEEIWENVSANAKKFIKRLLVTDPNLRPTARKVQKDPWLVEMADRRKTHDDSALNPSVVKALVNFKEYSDMRKLLCEVLSFTLIPDQIQGLRKEFEKMDTDGSGEITLSALKTVLLGNAAQGSLGALTEEEVEDIFNAMRVSKTETTIHWHEFIAAGLSHCKVDERNLKLAFDRLDADHTGYITFENFMDLIGNGAVHSEEALREMWGEASMSSPDAHITYEDFLLLMKGQVLKPHQPMMQPQIRSTTPMVDKLMLHPLMEGEGEGEGESDHPPSAERLPPPAGRPAKGALHGSFTGAFMSPTSFEQGDEFSDGPICIDEEGDVGTLNQAFDEAMKYQGSGFSVKGSLARPASPADSPPVDRTRSKSFDGAEESAPAAAVPLFIKNTLRAVNLPEHNRTDNNVNNMLNDKTKTNLVVNRELYRAHRSMRLAVLEASKRLEEEQQRRAREEMQKERARSNKAAGLIMRHGGELSADAIRQFVVQQQKEEQKKVDEASKRAGRRGHARNRTASDIRGMFGNSGSGANNLTLPTQRETTGGGSGMPDFRPPLSPGKDITPLIQSKPTIGSNSSDMPDMPDLPKLRDGTKPGQFRRTTYDPFSFGIQKSTQKAMDGGDLMRDTSFHRHLDLGIAPTWKANAQQGGSELKSSGSDTDIAKVPEYN